MGVGVAAEYTFQHMSVFVTLRQLGVQCPGLFIIATGQIMEMVVTFHIFTNFGECRLHMSMMVY